MNELRYAVGKEHIRVYHHIVLGLAFIKDCPLLKKNDYATQQVMTKKWFNSIVDWLCNNYPEEFRLKGEVIKEVVSE